MKRVLATSLMALLLCACGGKTTAVKTDDGPLIEENVEKDRPLAWRKACCKLMGKPAPAEGDDGVTIGDEKDANMAACLKGFMAMESERAAEAARCVINAADEEAAFWCLESGQDELKKNSEPIEKNP